MSVQFGRWNFDGTAVDPEYIAKVRTLLEAHAPDGVAICVKGTFVMLYGAVHTTGESTREHQPFASPAGTFLTWDGRLDNRAELRGNIDPRCLGRSDLQIVASSWEQNGVRGLGRLVGDWALSVVNHYERTLFLAKDFLGTRPLYYLRGDRYVAWSSLLDPLILLSSERFTLCEEYVAGWLAGYPEAHLTPYEEIRAVPPASFVRITGRATTVEKYWDFPAKAIPPLKSDAEYEERFRALFSDAVRRRLRSDSPVLAELSGGMDSSSIVCVADKLVDEEGTRPVATVSLFDDSEPNWNERPFFTAVEAQRGHTGLHLNVRSDGRFLPERDGGFPVTPAHGARPSVPQTQFARFLREGGFRVLLSGTGGDEFTGGVPTGIPELADLLRRGKLQEFLQRSFLWALAGRKPLLHVVARTLRAFVPAGWATNSSMTWPMPWLAPSFARRHRRTLSSSVTRFQWFGPLPTFQENLRALDGLRRQVACAELPPSPSCEKRYPFLDRDLLEFLFNVPREQLVRPHQRRSLLRRALRGTVPDVVLDRPRKAFVSTSPLKAIAADWPRIADLTQEMMLESRRMLDSEILRVALEQARRGGDVPLLPLMRVLRIEWWMKDPHIQRVFGACPPMQANGFLLHPQARGRA